MGEKSSKKKCSTLINWIVRQFLRERFQNVPVGKPLINIATSDQHHHLWPASPPLISITTSDQHHHLWSASPPLISIATLIDIATSDQHRHLWSTLPAWCCLPPPSFSVCWQHPHLWLLQKSSDFRWWKCSPASKQIFFFLALHLHLAGNSPCLTQVRLQQQQEQRYKLLTVCVVFLCVQTKVWLSTFGIFNMLRGVYACDCKRGQYRHHERVCTESWLWEKNPLPHWGVKPASAAC